MARAEVVTVHIRDLPEIQKRIADLTDRAETAEAAIEQARAALLQGGQTASIRARAALAALDGTEATDG